MSCNGIIIEGGVSAWDKEEDVVKLYNKGVPVKEIRDILSISAPTFNKMVKQFKEEGKIIPRRKPYNFKKKKAKEPKYYKKHTDRAGFDVIYRKKYYAYVQTKQQAEMFVKLMKQCNWDYSKRLTVKKQVMESLE